MNGNIEEFIKILVSEIRDEAIDSGDNTVSAALGDRGHVVSQRWKSAIREGDWEKLLSMVVADTVDNTVFQLLRSIDDGSLPLDFKGINLSTAGGGELGGSYMGEWRETISERRHYDDFGDL